MSIWEKRLSNQGEIKRQFPRNYLTTAAAETAGVFGVYDEIKAPKEHQACVRVFDRFVRAVYQSASEQKLIDQATKQQFIESFSSAVSDLHQRVTKSDNRDLGVFTQNTEPNDQESDSRQEIKALQLQIRELEPQIRLLRIQNKSEEAEKLAGIKNELVSRFYYLKTQTFSGRSKFGYEFSDSERKEHEQSVRESRARIELDPKRRIWLRPEWISKTGLSLGRKRPPVVDFHFDARAVAEAVVNEYERLLIVNKVTMGIEANYSDAEILGHLGGVLSNKEESELAQTIKQLRKDRSQGSGKAISTFKIYREILTIVFRNRKLAAIGLLSSVVGLGYIAPISAQQTGDFVRHLNEEALWAGLGGELVNVFGRTGVSMYLSSLMNQTTFGDIGVGEMLYDRVLSASPKMFTKTDRALIRGYIAETLDNITGLVSSTVEGVCLHLSQIIGLASSVAVRLGNPRLFGLVMGATFANAFVSIRKGKEVADKRQKVRRASSVLFTRLDEAVSMRILRGKVQKIERTISLEIYKAKKELIKVLGQYKAGVGIIYPIMLFLNGIMTKDHWNDQNYTGDYAQGAILTSRLTSELSALIEEVVNIRNLLRPVLELVTLRANFLEKGRRIPHSHAIEIDDLTASSLHIDHLSIPQGTKAMVIGKRGAGKSTLFRLIYGITAPERGLITVDDLSLKTFQCVRIETES